MFSTDTVYALHMSLEAAYDWAWNSNKFAHDVAFTTFDETETGAVIGFSRAGYAATFRKSVTRFCKRVAAQAGKRFELTVFGNRACATFR